MIEKVKKESQQLFAIPTEDNINKCGVNLASYLIEPELERLRGQS